MHLITLTERVNTVTFGWLEKGSYVVQDRNAWEIGMIAEWGTMTADYFPERKETFGPIIIIRSGAWGDLLLLTPVLRAFKEANPRRSIFLSCGRDKFPMMDGIMEGRLLGYPLHSSNVDLSGHIISLEEAFETQPDKHITDAFAEKLGVTVTDYRPIYRVTAEEKEAAENLFPKRGPYPLMKPRPRIAVQMLSSSRNRNYPIQKWAEVVLKLQASGWEVMLLGTKGSIPRFQPQIYQEFIHNLADKGLTFRESAAVLACCDAFVGVDSAFIHLCHALDIPAVGLYGAFRWETRTGKAPKTFAITGVGDCKGCSWHVHNGQDFPPNKPCSTKRECVVLSSIEPDRVVDRVNKLKP